MIRHWCRSFHLLMLPVVQGWSVPPGWLSLILMRGRVTTISVLLLLVQRRLVGEQTGQSKQRVVLVQWR